MVLSSQNNLNQALIAHQAGRLEEAEARYRKIIAENLENSDGSENLGDNADVWHLLGALCHQKGNISEAEQHLSHALSLAPQFPEALNTRGILFKEEGRLVEAAADFRQALALLPEFPQAMANLGDVLRRIGKFEAAREQLTKALKLAPDLAPAYNNLGALERDLSKLESALAAFQSAIALDPHLIDAAINLATTLNSMGKHDEALAAAQQTVLKTPDYAPAQNCLGTLYFATGNNTEAQRHFEKACQLAVNYAEAHNNLANSLTRLNNLADAQRHYDIALKLEPLNADFWANKAAAYQAENNIAAALKACEQALSINPHHADARWNRGIAELISGNLPAGFADYETRWELPEFKRREFTAPEWSGEALADKSILIHSEQGYGDTLQFIRYAALLAAENPTAIYLETPAPLSRLIATMPEITGVFVRGAALPTVDFQIPLMSLPLRCGTALATIPQITPYLTAPLVLPADFPTYNDNATKARIGLVWAGRATHKNDRNRSLALAALQPLITTPTVQFYSLQLGTAQKELKDFPTILDLSPYLDDFAATAAILEHLDLVITVDTAIAHLAGALGVKCWVMLPFAPDWRWLLNRNDSPWYPSLTLFRQATPGDWTPVIQRITEALAGLDYSTPKPN